MNKKVKNIFENLLVGEVYEKSMLTNLVNENNGENKSKLNINWSDYLYNVWDDKKKKNEELFKWIGGNKVLYVGKNDEVKNNGVIIYDGVITVLNEGKREKFNIDFMRIGDWVEGELRLFNGIKNFEEWKELVKNGIEKNDIEKLFKDCIKEGSLISVKREDKANELNIKVGGYQEDGIISFKVYSKLYNEVIGLMKGEEFRYYGYKSKVLGVT